MTAKNRRKKEDKKEEEIVLGAALRMVGYKVVDRRNPGC
jgi:hypothetical protein